MLELIIDPTSRCNYSCEFCYNKAEGEIGIEDVLAIIKESSAKDFSIGGGEPFLYKQLPEVLEAAGKFDRITIPTNGSVWRDDILALGDGIKKKMVVQVSLFAMDKNRYKAITGASCLDIVLNNIERFREHFNTVISTPIYKKNLDDVADIIEYAKNRDMPVNIALVFSDHVQLLDKNEIKRLKNLLWTEKLAYSRLSSGLLKRNNCSLVEVFYGIKKTAECPADNDSKCYYSLDKKVYKCEFFPILK